MTQAEKGLYLIKYLISEDSRYGEIQIPKGSDEQKRLLRALFNIRMPRKADSEFLKIQDEYLREETRRKGITDLADLKPVQENIYLWRGDITTLRCGAVVNAANSRMLGCFCPNHGCIDNAIHTYAGIQLREACAELMKAQGYEEETGKAKITPAFNLPCDYVIHTVGPIVGGRLTKKDESLLASCYRSCLEAAEENNIKSLAICCISTGEFHFPNERAAEIAVKTVKEYREEKQSKIEVIFNVFKEIDFKIYGKLLK
ncbi:MAG: protein-ADP-ribose hydrolase [Clostridiales bacterium]|nr:protein-ADP-ribose hydrolase [Clostridiales bacterium]